MLNVYFNFNDLSFICETCRKIFFKIMKLNCKVNYNLRAYTFYIIYVYYFIKYLGILVKIVSFFFNICVILLTLLLFYVTSNRIRYK